MGLFLTFSIFLLFAGGFHGWVLASSSHSHGFNPRKLFVFGDSYSDTGNIRKSLASSWKVPYGVTFPGKPAGRFSDGRVLTDYVAKFLGLKSPVPYKWRKQGGKKLRNGMNFAHGGTGVFDTVYKGPNMTSQISLFQELITKNNSLYSKTDLQSSVALVTLAGNDYSTYLANNGTVEGALDFITRVTEQLTVNLKRIHRLGVRKISVTSLEPMGCLPRSTILFSSERCNDTENAAASFHNILLQQAVTKLNNETRDSPFVVLDLFSSFTAALKFRKKPTGGLKFEKPLKPCCMGISSKYSCGEVDKKGRKLYTVCNDTKSAFFWDMVHPTQAGWRAVYFALKQTLNQITQVYY